MLSDRARQAFLEYQPLRISSADPQRIYRSYAHGPLLEVFMLDERSYRGKNSPNRQEKLDREANFLAPLQLEWLKTALKKIDGGLEGDCERYADQRNFERWEDGLRSLGEWR